ncbi:hypothetical protein QIA34_07685 (plasmid) [Borreliella yangtzensis]|uniref:Outer membrane biosynthesis protein TonB n=1 Tax=Borreliella yangtzensis TaxID=683292 RepID=A0ABR6PBC7_9SPIR|nr:outer membrane biosynthesis protein TonB [Borreliella yangtzensis]
MNKKMFIICAVFALIISCDNHGNLKQGVEGKVKGFREGIEKKVKQGIKQTEQKVKGFLEKVEGIISTDPTVSKIAEKLKEEEKLKESANNGGQERREQNREDNKKQEKEQQEQNVEVQVAEEKKVEKVEEVKRQEEKENLQVQETQVTQVQEQAEQKEKSEEEQVKQEENLQVETAEAEAEVEIEVEEEEEDEEEKAKAKIKDLTNKIDKISKDIDSIKHQSWFVEDVKRVIVGATEVRDKVTGPIYDDFTDDPNKSIYHAWGLTDEDDDFSKLLKKLGETRSALRTKLNVNNEKLTSSSRKEPSLKENVKVSEIESDLEKLKSELGEVKEYLKDQSHFETIKGYINDDSNRIDDDE